MNRKEVTASLAARTEKYIDPNNDPRIYWAKEVTFDYATTNAARVDYMQFKPRNNSVSGIEAGAFYCFEIKSSVEDFHSKHGHNFIGDYNYYVMTEDVFLSVERAIPYAVGVLVPNNIDSLYVVKKADRKDRCRSVSDMLMMMWRSSRRELVKLRRTDRTD